MTEGKSAEQILRWAGETFEGSVALASSLSLEDQALTDMIARTAPAVPVFTLDTGRLFPETLELLARTEERYGIRIQVFFPPAPEVEELVERHGINLFRESVELRRRCCFVRKVLPLRRALSGRRAWISGLRREQSSTRGQAAAVEWDESNQLVKVSPLVSWGEAQVRDYLADRQVPYNPLHDQRFVSIGCACCTRAVKPGDDPRSGRWWWEAPEHKECGLHIVPKHGGSTVLRQPGAPE